LTATPVEVSPDAPELAPLFDRHLILMRATSPACSVHAMEPDRLVAAGVRFFVVREANAPVAMGALKPVTADHGEIKSMHVVEEARGKGLAAAILMRLLDTAKEAGMTRVSLETGSQDGFRPARTFYASKGFELCPPFDGYVEDPNSVFMTRPV